MESPRPSIRAAGSRCAFPHFHESGERKIVDGKPIRASVRARCVPLAVSISCGSCGAAGLPRGERPMLQKLRRASAITILSTDCRGSPESVSPAVFETHVQGRLGITNHDALSESWGRRRRSQGGRRPPEHRPIHRSAPDDEIGLPLSFRQVLTDYRARNSGAAQAAVPRRSRGAGSITLEVRLPVRPVWLPGTEPTRITCRTRCRTKYMQRCVVARSWGCPYRGPHREHVHASAGPDRDRGDCLTSSDSSGRRHWSRRPSALLLDVQKVRPRPGAPMVLDRTRSA